MQSIHKLAEDFEESYGDGGGGRVEFPVYFRHFKKKDDGASRDELRSTLNAIDQSRMDVQPNGIVHDIIDPCLNSRMLDVAELKEFLAQRLENQDGKEDENDRYRLHATSTHLYMSYMGIELSHRAEKYTWNDTENLWVLEAILGPEHHDMGYSDGWESASIPWIAVPPGIEGWRFVYQESGIEDDEDEYIQPTIDAKMANMAMEAQRGAFQWVPTVVHCEFDPTGSTKTAKFLGDIAGLPPRQVCEGLYKAIESTLSNMLPLLAQLPSVPGGALQNGDLQVVVKAQKYVLPPHSSYTGRWHTEGFTENIAAAGVYYIHVSNETTGGSLSFRPRETPNPHYFRVRRTTEIGHQSNQNDNNEDAGEWWYHYVRNVPVRSGTAVVFSNTIPHRFRTIKNETDQTQERLFINFFIVSPNNPLAHTTSTLPTPILVRSVMEATPITDPRIQELIVPAFTGAGFGPSVQHKVARDRARLAMAANRPHWSVMNYGNSGAIVYHEDSRQWDSESYRFGLEYNMFGLNGESSDNEHSGCSSSGLGSGM